MSEILSDDIKERLTQLATEAIPDYKAKRKAYLADPINHKKKLESNTKWAHTPKGKAVRKAYSETPEYKAKQREYMRGYSLKPEYKMKRKKWQKKWREIPENKVRLNSYNKRLQRQRRNDILKGYGNVCACCGETEDKFLGIDHISGKGAKHRKKVAGGALYSWLIKHNFPPGFQLLCHNCNLAKGFYGKCPHEVQNATIH